MSNRPQPLSAEEQNDIGRTVLGARQLGVCWKHLERELGMSRRQLWRCVQRHVRQLAAGMSQESGRMSHQGDC